MSGGEEEAERLERQKRERAATFRDHERELNRMIAGSTAAAFALLVGLLSAPNPPGSDATSIDLASRWLAGGLPAGVTLVFRSWWVPMQDLAERRTRAAKDAAGSPGFNWRSLAPQGSFLAASAFMATLMMSVAYAFDHLDDVASTIYKWSSISCLVFIMAMEWLRAGRLLVRRHRPRRTK